MRRTILKVWARVLEIFKLIEAPPYVIKAIAMSKVIKFHISKDFRKPMKRIPGILRYRISLVGKEVSLALTFGGLP